MLNKSTKTGIPQINIVGPEEEEWCEPIFDFNDFILNEEEHYRWIMNIKEANLPPISKAAQDVDSVVFDPIFE